MDDRGRAIERVVPRGAAPHGMLLLWGSVGHLIASLELHFEDRTTIPLTLHQGWVLYQVNPRNFVPGHRPSTLIGRICPVA
jgi:hypothetical protein